MHSMSAAHCPGTHAAELINASRDKGEDCRYRKQGLCHNYSVFDYLVGLNFFFFFHHFLLPPLISL